MVLPIEQAPPNNEEAEQVVLGSMLIDSNSIDDVLDSIEAGDFYRRAHVLIFDSIVDTYEQRGACDIMLVLSTLRARGHEEEAGGHEYLAHLVACTPSAANAKHYADVVKELSRRRQMLTATHEAVRGVHQGLAAADVAAGLERAIDRANGHAIHEPSLSDTLSEVFTRMDQAKEGVLGIQSGYYDLDRITLGWHPGNLVIIAGRPGMGKSTFAHNVLAHAAIRDGIPCAFFSCEMPRHDLAQAMLSALSGVPLEAIRTGRASAEEHEALAAAAATLAGVEERLRLIEAPGITPSQIRSRTRRLVRRHGVQIIAVDHIQIMGQDLRTEDDVRIVTEASKQLKRIALELSIPVLAVSQLNREVEKRRPPKPRLSDLRSSGAIEQDADAVLFMYREGYYRPKDEDVQPFGEVLVRKNRMGVTGDVTLGWRGQCVRWENPTPEAVAEYEGRARLGAGGRPKDVDLRMLILELLASAPMSFGELRDEISRRLGRDVVDKTVRRWCQRLEDEGKLHQPKRGAWAIWRTDTPTDMGHRTDTNGHCPQGGE